MKFCTHCGAELAPGARFCTHCGQAVAAPAADTSEAPTSYASNPPAGSSPAAGAGSTAASTAASGAGSSAASSAASNDGAYGAAAANPAPWAAGGAAGSGAAFSTGDVKNSARKMTAPLRKIPKPVAIGLAALLAAGAAGGTAWMLRPAPTMAIDTHLTNQQFEALKQAPERKWSVSNEDLAAAVGISSDATSNASATVKGIGKDGIVLAQVTGYDSNGSKSTIVGLPQNEQGKVAWKAEGTAVDCFAVNNGWVCKYSAPSDSDSYDSTSSPQQLVLLDNKGKISKLADMTDQDTLYRDFSGNLWLYSGLPSSSESDSSSSDSSSSQATTVSVQKITADGKLGWKYREVLNRPSVGLSTDGIAGAPIFTVDGVTYLRGVQDADGGGIGLDSSGQRKDDVKPVLGNVRGQLVTYDEKKGTYLVNGEKMKETPSKLTAPTITDTAETPTFAQNESEVKKLSDDGQEADWSKQVGESKPVASCGGVTVFDEDGWGFDNDGKQKFSGALKGTPTFCWGGQHLMSVESGSLIATDVNSGQEAWRVQLKTTDDGSSSGTYTEDVAFSPTANGFAASDSEGIALWAK